MTKVAFQFPALEAANKAAQAQHQPVLQFRGKYKFLSNFTASPIRMQGVIYPTVEAAFQAAKTVDPEQRKQFVTLDPSQARTAGRNLDLRPDWEEIKLEVMRSALRQKFRAGTPLAQKLLETRTALLVEGNYWSDTFWGFSLQKGYGHNWLGRLLMERRAELQQQAGQQPLFRQARNAPVTPLEAVAEVFAASTPETSSKPVQTPIRAEKPNTPITAPVDTPIEMPIHDTPIAVSTSNSPDFADTPPWV